MKRCPISGTTIAAALIYCGGHHTPELSAEMLDAASGLSTAMPDEPVFYSGVSVHRPYREADQPYPAMPSNDVTRGLTGITMRAGAASAG
jgi:hypothetical protein